tara:strand:+ start:7392 stop:7859 length:468 start_codon:yes stop_codon:yes gene_type:complete
MTNESLSAELSELRNDLTSVVGALKSVAETQKLQGEQQKDQMDQIRELGRAYSEIAAGRGKISVGLILAIVGPIIAIVVATAKLGHTFVGQEIQRIEGIDNLYNRGLDTLREDHIKFIPEWGQYKERVDTIQKDVDKIKQSYNVKNTNTGAFLNP